MRQYGLSEGRIRRVIASPKRTEPGVAPKTTAVMQPAGSGKHPHEIWVMYQELKLKGKSEKFKGVAGRTLNPFIPSQKRIITAWRYPGISKKREAVPIPSEILDELDGMI